MTSFPRFLAVRSCRTHSTRAAALGLVAAVLACALFGGSLVVLSLQHGLARFQERLGADVIVLPREAAEMGALEGVLVQGVPAHFYMEAHYLDDLRGMTGVAQAAPQFFLASAHAGCCSVAVQLIGFDPASDFTIRPWMQESRDAEMGFGEILVGSGISIPTDSMLTFYNTPCRVVGRLSPTGTGMDTAEGFTPEGMAAAINEIYPALSAKAAHGMVHHVEEGLDGITRVIGILLSLVWLFAALILGIAFRMAAHERRREFAILRIVGAPRATLIRTMLTESALISAAGGAAGILTGAVVLIPFAGLMKESLTRPYLLPDLSAVLLLGAGVLAVTVLAGVLSAVWTIRRVSAGEPGEMLREDG